MPPTPITRFDFTVESWRVAQPYPEGIAYDQVNKRVLLSSLKSNTIMAFDATDNMEPIRTYTPSTEKPSSLGLKLDSDGKVHAMLADFSTLDGGGYAVYDLPVDGVEVTVESGPLSFPCTEDEGEKVCGMGNDVAIASDNIVYITDSYLGRVFKVENGTMELVSDDPLLSWVDEATPFGVDGIAYDSRGFLIINNYATKKLVKIDLATKEATEIKIDAELEGNPDGMLLGSNGRLFVVAGGTKLYVVEENGDEWATATIVGSIDIDNSALGEIAASAAFGETENEIYFSHVRFGDLFGGGTNDKPSLLTKITYNDASIGADEL